MNKTIERIIFVLVCLIVTWLLLIFILSSQNGEQTLETSNWIANILTRYIPIDPMNIRKIAHIFLFFILGILLSMLYIGLNKRFPYKERIIMILLLISCILPGFFDEWHKQFIEGRHFQIDEACLNILSCFIGTSIILIILKVLHIVKRPAVH